MRRIAILLLLIALLIVPFASAWEPTEKTKFVAVWSGSKPITDSLTSKSYTDKTLTLKVATDTVMSKASYPYEISKTATSFKILKYRCDNKMQICGYWVEATRYGLPVKTNSPVWISPPPVIALVSEVYDEKSDTVTTTLKEDPKLALEQILQQYVDNQPIGIPVIGTKA
jgi:hypothetical protein